MITGLLALALLAGTEDDAARVAGNPALMAAIDRQAIGTARCGKAAIERYLSARGYSANDAEGAAKALGAATSAAAGECVTSAKVAEIARLIRSSMPGIGESSADEIARAILLEHVSMSLFSDGR